MQFDFLKCNYSIDVSFIYTFSDSDKKKSTNDPLVSLFKSRLIIGLNNETINNKSNKTNNIVPLTL